MTTTFKPGLMQLKGAELLEYVKAAEENERSRSVMVFGAGYVREDGKLAWTDFYESLLEAKKTVNPDQLKSRKISASIPLHDGPAIYVACLASYNKGILFGRWIDLEECEDLHDLQQCVKQVLAESPEPMAEEWAVHDSQGLPEFLGSQEYPDLSDLNDYAEGTANVSDRDAYQLACENEGAILSEEGFSEVYYGHYSSTAQFAEDYYEQQGVLRDLPTELAYAIDWDRVWDSEFDCAGWHAHYANGGYYIFSN